MARRSRGGWLDSAAVPGTILLVVILGNLFLNSTIHSPPRFDGAGYAVLARSIASGSGYRQIDHPDRPPHAHFPPGYPAALALVWAVAGRSAVSAHLFSILCTTLATLLTWRWLVGLYGPRPAFWMGLALACNWRWGRDGSAILSEPFFLLETALVLRTVQRIDRHGRDDFRCGLVVGLLAGLAILTRQVGVGLALAAVLHLVGNGRRRSALAAVLGALILAAPWVVWVTVVRQPSQVGLLPRSGLAGLVAGQALFYLRRIPDQIIGPIVEIGTVFRPRLAGPMTAAAALGTGLILAGWCRAGRSPRRRLAAAVPGLTLPILLVWPYTEAGRFLIPLIPMILVGAVEGLARPLGRRRRAALLVLAASIPYTGYAAIRGRAAAQEELHEPFDDACRWLVRPGALDGPVLTRHPGEVFWQTGRNALAPDSDDPDAIARQIDRYGVVYLLIDDDRYARAPTNPLSRFVARVPDRVEEVWNSGRGVRIARTRPAHFSKTSRP